MAILALTLGAILGISKTGAALRCYSCTTDRLSAIDLNIPHTTHLACGETMDPHKVPTVSGCTMCVKMQTFSTEGIEYDTTYTRHCSNKLPGNTTMTCSNPELSKFKFAQDTIIRKTTTCHCNTDKCNTGSEVTSSPYPLALAVLYSGIMLVFNI